MKKLFLLAAFVMALNLVVPVGMAHAYSANVYEAQRIMTKFNIPDGPLDGYDGPQTRRGLCIFRYMSGLTVNRNALDSTTLSKLKSYDKAYSSLSRIPAKYTSSRQEVLVAHETCQAMTLSQKASPTSTKHMFWRVMAISTGTNAKICDGSSGKVSCNTPNGTYSLSGTQRGWQCSTAYPDGCRYQTTGINLRYGRYGNMYNFRTFRSGGWGVHGSLNVPTYPASHGCIRVSVSNSDWMFKEVGNDGIIPKIIVTGAY